MKKTTAVLIVAIMVFMAFSGMALAAPPYEGKVNSHAVMLLDATTGEVLFEKNADETILPASTTKILTCIVALENASLDDTVEVGPEGDWTGSGYSLLGTKNGEKISMKDLIYGMMLVSGNDAAAAIAVHVGGSIEGFAEMMNKKAEELGMTGSHFVTPHGADTEGHYVTARDMATLSLYAMKNEQFMDIVGTASYNLAETNKNAARVAENTNKLLLSAEPEYYSYATGIKTGSTPQAFRCLVSSAEKDGTKLLCLIFGDETQDGTERWPLSKALFEYGFENYSTVDVQKMIDRTGPLSVKVSGASADDEQNGELALQAVNEGKDFLTMDKNLSQSIDGEGLTASVELSGGETLKAPVKAGAAVGTVTYKTKSGETVARAQLLASRDVADASGHVDIRETKKQVPAAKGTNAWLWIVLGAVLVAAVVLLVMNLRRSRRLVRRKYARRRPRNYSARGARRR